MGLIVASIKKHRLVIILLLFLVVGLYLRFYQIGNVFSYGWDQGRDAFAVRDILQGRIVLDGPRTGVGHFHLGPIYYYLLAPWYALTSLDPIAAQYFNIVAFVFNFVCLYIVFKKLTSVRFALLILFTYIFSRYWISASEVPWNVSLVPGFSALIFYVYYQVISGKTSWLPILSTLAGFFFNLHFTAVFFAFIFLPILIFLPRNRKSLLPIILSVPTFLIWLVPNYLYVLQSNNLEYFRLSDFWRDYFIGFHVRFLLHRLPDSLIEFEPLISSSAIGPILKYAYPVTFIVLAAISKLREKKLAVVALSFLAGPLIGFTVYGGPISDYYFYLTLPAVLYIFWTVNFRLLRFLPKTAASVVLAFWAGIFFWQNTTDLWVKPGNGGLTAQESQVREVIKNGGKISYQEGDIKAYLYTIWTHENKNP